VHQGEFVRGSYGRIGAATSAVAAASASEEEEEEGGAGVSDDDDPLMGVKLPKGSKGESAGPRAAHVAPASPLFGATTFNPYSFAQRASERRKGSFSSSSSDTSRSPPPAKGKKLLPVANAVPALKLPAVAVLQGQQLASSGPVLSGYDSWSEDDGDAEAGGGGGGGADDDWSDTEAPQQPVLPVNSAHKLKPAAGVSHAAAALTPPSSSGGSAAERVEAWASRHAVGGLLGLMLHMRRC
jgi:hypothetical protein